CRRDRARPAEIGVERGHVVEDADLDGALVGARPDARADKQGGDEDGAADSHSTTSHDRPAPRRRWRGVLPFCPDPARNAHRGQGPHWRCRLRGYHCDPGLAPAMSDPVLRLYLDWAAGVSEVAPHLLSYRPAYLLRQRGQRLASRSAAAFKRTVISI